MSPAARKDKQSGRIAASSIYPVWNWISQSLIRDEVASYCAGIKTDVLGYRLDNANLRAQEFWAIASSAILSALNSDVGRKAARSPWAATPS